jgi:predicted DNA-binding transcriptional regulator YafY
MGVIPSPKKMERGGNSLVVRFKANKEEGPVRWILQFGSFAEVLEPQSLRERVREGLKASLNAFGD